jgi:hypothetical protein
MRSFRSFTSRLRPPASAIASIGFLVLFTSLLPARSQDSSLRAERAVAYVTGKTLPLAAKVGPVSIQNVQFTDRGRASSSGGLTGMIRGGSASDTSTTIRGHFAVENPSPDEWEVTFTLEFLDRSGKLIDKAIRKSTWEGEAKPYDFDHTILQYVVPSIAQVRITLEGRLD